MAKKKAEKKKEEKVDTNFLAPWAEKLERPFEELEAEFMELLEKTKEKHGNYKLPRLIGIARRRIYGKYKAEMRSSAGSWLMCPLYATEPNDYGSNHYAKNMAAWKKSSIGAQKAGKVRIEKDATGNKQKVIPLEEREDKKSYGKPLPRHAWIQNVGGIAIPYSAFEDEDWSLARPFEITLFSPYADPNSPRFFGGGFKPNTWYRVKVTNKTDKDEEDIYTLGATSVSNWNEPFEDLAPLEVEDIITYYKPFYVPLGELNQYHEEFCELSDDGTASYSNRLVVTEGSVIDITLAEGESNSHMLLLDDEESLGFGEGEDEDIPESVTAWIPKEFEINFGKFSEIMLFGKTSRKLQQDLATEEYLDEWRQTTISGYTLLVTFLEEPEEVEETAGGDSEEDASVDIPDEEEKEIPNIENPNEESPEQDGDTW